MSNSRGTGAVSLCKEKFPSVTFEDGVRLFLPEYIKMGKEIYIGHDTIINGYYNKVLSIGHGSWIGPQCHIFGDIKIGQYVGIGSQVVILSSQHTQQPCYTKLYKNGKGPILHNPIEFKKIVIGAGSDIGAHSTILPGVKIGRFCQIGAGSVVTRNIPDFAIAVGSPAKVIKFRNK